MRLRPVTIRLTRKQAEHVWKNADGWLDAGACEGGLRRDERSALHSLCEQILPHITKAGKELQASDESDLRARILSAIEGAGFAWHSDDEAKVLDAIMDVVG